MSKLHALSFKLSDLNSSTGIFTGYASTFDRTPDAHGDLIQKGAFAETLQRTKGTRSWPAMLFAHDPARPIGVWKSIAEDDKGLNVVGKLTLGVRDADETLLLLKDGAVSGLSIGYIPKDAIRDKATGARILTKMDLIEISVVVRPANDGARVVQVRWQDIDTVRKFETLMRDVGCPKQRAKVLAKNFSLTATDRRDVDPSAAETARAIRAHAAAIISATDPPNENPRHRRRTA